MRDVLRRRLGLRTWRPSKVAPHREVEGVSDLARWQPRLPDDRWTPLDQTSPVERAWVRRFVQCDLGDRGAVVELGSWLGAMTLAIGEGLEARRGPRPPFHTYDRFRFEDQAHVFGGAFEGVEYVEGGSFRHIFDERTEPVAALVEVHEGPVEAAAWPRDAPIGLLINDVSKTWATWLAVRRTFYRALSPGSVVVEQDFAHFAAPWLHLSLHRWRPYLEPLGCIPGSGSVVMRVTAEIPPDELDRNDPVEGFTSRQVQEAFDWAESLVDPSTRPDVRAARVMLYVLSGDLDVAVAELMMAVEEGLFDGELVTEVLPALSSRYVARTQQTSASPIRTIRTAFDNRSNDRPARRRGDPWHAR